MTTFRMDNVLLRITAQSDIYSKAPMAGELIFDWENWNARFTEKTTPKRPPRPYAERNRTVFNNQLGTVLTQNPQTGTYHLECYFDLDGVNDWQKLQSIMSEVYRNLPRPLPRRGEKGEGEPISKYVTKEVSLC